MLHHCHPHRPEVPEGKSFKGCISGAFVGWQFTVYIELIRLFCCFPWTKFSHCCCHPGFARWCLFWSSRLNQDLKKLARISLVRYEISSKEKKRSIARCSVLGARFATKEIQVRFEIPFANSVRPWFVLRCHHNPTRNSLDAL